MTLQGGGYGRKAPYLISRVPTALHEIHSRCEAWRGQGLSYHRGMEPSHSTQGVDPGSAASPLPPVPGTLHTHKSPGHHCHRYQEHHTQSPLHSCHQNSPGHHCHQYQEHHTHRAQYQKHHRCTLPQDTDATAHAGHQKPQAQCHKRHSGPDK